MADPESAHPPFWNSSTTAQQLVLEVPSAPPDPKPEVKTPCPAPGHIWVAGYWDYIGGHHVWRDGRWLQGMAGYEYVRARYEFDGKTWQFHVPHWHKRAGKHWRKWQSRGYCVTKA